jgi:hypothetical protein
MFAEFLKFRWTSVLITQGAYPMKAPLTFQLCYAEFVACVLTKRLWIVVRAFGPVLTNPAKSVSHIQV